MKEKEGSIAAKQLTLCPFIEDPYDDCFIANLHSLNVACCLNYCGRNFEDCRIYKNHSRGMIKTKWNVLI